MPNAVSCLLFLQLEDADVLTLVKELRHLEHLDISSTYISDEALEFIAQVQPRYLRKLDLAGCTTVDGKTYQTDMNHCVLMTAPL